MTGSHESASNDPSPKPEGAPRILIEGLNWIGDSIMSLPALNAFRRRHPAAFISMLVKPGLVPLWRLLAFADQVLVLEQDCWATWRTAGILRSGSANGPEPKRLHFSASKDDGMTWSTVGDSELPNPGAGADIVTLSNGHWALAYNDLEEGRHSLAISISTDEGKTWKHTRHLERDSRDRDLATRSHYPSIIQGRGEILHVVYSHHYNDRKGAPHKTIKYARFDEAWSESK